MKQLSRKLVALILTCILFIPTYPVSFADSGYNSYTLPITVNQKTHFAEMLQTENDVYISASSLSAIKACYFRIVDATDKVLFYLTEDRIIYSIDLKNCVKQDEKWYLPLQSASDGLGCFFYEKDSTYHCNVFRNATEFLFELDELFYDEYFYLYNQLTDEIWLGQAASRIYTLLSFWDLETLFESASKKLDQKYYDKAFYNLLTQSGTDLEFTQKMIGLDSGLTNAAKTVSKIENILDEDGKLAKFLRDKGVDEKLLKAFYSNRGVYAAQNFAVFLKYYANTVETLDIKGLLESLEFYMLSSQMDENTLLAMNLVFDESDDKYIAKSAKEILRIYGLDGNARGLDLLNDHGEDMFLSSLLEAASDALTQGPMALINLGISSVDLILDEALDLDQNIDITFLIPVYCNMQFDLADYYFSHRYDDEPETVRNLQAIAATYIKTVIAYYNSLSFDSDMAASAPAHLALCYNTLEKVISYSEVNLLNGEFVNSIKNRPNKTEPPQYPNEESFPTLNISGENAPSRLILNENFGIRGEISTDCGLITQVIGSILDSDGTTIQIGKYNPNSTVHNLRYSVNNDLVFGKLSEGSYTYIVEATAKNGDKTTTSTLINLPFTVGNAAAAPSANPVPAAPAPVIVAPTISVDNPNVVIDMALSSSASVQFQLNGNIPENAYLGLGAAGPFVCEWGEGNSFIINATGTGDAPLEIMLCDGDTDAVISSQIIHVKVIDSSPAPIEYEPPYISSHDVNYPPPTLTKGGSFGIRGKISINLGTITHIRGEIVDHSGNVIMLSEFYPTNETVHDLRYSINKELVFGQLPEGSYIYRVFATAVNGDRSSTNTIVEAEFSIVAPSQAFVIEGLTAQYDTSSTARISWCAVPGATHYEVQYFSRAHNVWTPDGSYVSGTSYISTGLQKYDSWQYRVRAVGSGGCSAWSEVTYYK